MKRISKMRNGEFDSDVRLCAIYLIKNRGIYRQKLDLDETHGIYRYEYPGYYRL